MKYNLEPLHKYLNTVETLVSPARHLPADPPSIITGGYGETNPLLVHQGMIVSEALATSWRDADLAKLQAAIESHAGPSISFSQGEMCALLDLSYNIGIGAVGKHGLLGSQLWLYVLAGNKQAALAEFDKHDMANGKHLLGLQRRRHIEDNWFVSPGIIA